MSNSRRAKRMTKSHRRHKKDATLNLVYLKSRFTYGYFHHYGVFPDDESK